MPQPVHRKLSLHSAALLSQVALTGLMWLVCATSFAAPPSLSGVWLIENPSPQLLTIDGTTPPLKLEAQKLYEKNLAAYKVGDVSFDPTARQCASPGMPRLVTIPWPFEIIDRSQQLTFLFEWNHLFRTVRVADKPHGVDFTTAMGLAKAHRAADAVIVEANRFADTTPLDSFGLPHSEALQVTETWTPTRDAKRLELKLRIEDPQTFTQPWETTLRFRRLAGYQIKEDICLDRLAHGKKALERH